jgi:precorrin-2 dehydrogenase / sirohydrochlorin ferrochelatase
MISVNRYYPAFLDLKDRLCIVVGGGVVALRKVESLSACQAHVRVIAPAVVDEILALDAIEIVHKPYDHHDLAGAYLVIAATDDEATNLAVSRDAARRRIFCNVVDRPDQCSFIVPSVVERGPIKVAISTGGISPALSKRLRMELGAVVGAEYEYLAGILGRIRPMVLAQEGGHLAHKRVFEVLVNSDLIEAIRQNDKDRIDEILLQALGEPIDLEGIV